MHRAKNDETVLNNLPFAITFCVSALRSFRHVITDQVVESLQGKNASASAAVIMKFEDDDYDDEI